MTPQRRNTEDRAGSHGSRAWQREDVPDSSLWYSDREIGAARSHSPLPYTAEDFRQELRRIERRKHRIAALCVIGALAAIALIAVIALRSCGVLPS